jgi:hypothetical protein
LWLFRKMKLKLKGHRFVTTERSRMNRRECLILWQKSSSRKRSKMEMVGPVSTCERKLLRGWWWPIGHRASFRIFIAPVWNILDTHSYLEHSKQWPR